VSHDKTANSNLTEGFSYCDLRFCINNFHLRECRLHRWVETTSLPKDRQEQTLIIMRMIVNIICNPAGAPIKSNADERDIHAFEEMVAKIRARSLATVIFSLISTTGWLQAVD
jgi:hypothetical protein